MNDHLPNIVGLKVLPPSLLELTRGFRISGPTGRQPALFCVMQGSLYLTSGDDEPLPVSAGNAFLILPGTDTILGAHKLKGRDKFALCRRMKHHGEVPTIGTPRSSARVARVLVAHLGADGARSGTPSSSLLMLDFNAIGNLRLAFAAALAELDTPQPGQRMLIAALMQTCLVHLYRHHVTDDGVDRTCRTAPAIEAITSDPGAAPVPRQLADLCGMSGSTFRRHFLRETGMGLQEFVLKERLDRAADMLRSTQAPIKVIADRCGFASRSHFSRSFRQRNGVDPSSFRATQSDQSGELIDGPLAPSTAPVMSGPAIPA